MTKVVSIALFGTDGKDGSGMNYHAYLPSFIIAFHGLFSREEGWELRLHIDTYNNKTGEFAKRLQECGIMHIKVMGTPIKTKAMLWRLAPVFSGDTDVVFCRDIDCIPMPRDRVVCDQFLASPCEVSACMDSQSHAGVMGGMSGFKAAPFRLKTGLRSLDDLYTFAKTSDAEWAQHGTDQNVLNRLIDRLDGPVLLEHRYNGWHAGPKTYPAKPAGTYACKAYSTPTPDVGKSKLTPELTAKADLLANHLGAAGYDHVAARAFWEQHGDPTIAKLVRECESP